MLHLLNIEFLKLQRNRSFLILIILFIVSVFGANYIVYEVSTNTGHIVHETSNKSFRLFEFPEVWQFVSFISSFLLIIPCFTVIMHTCSEYTYRTHRQNIIDGLSREQYITAKILYVVSLALFATILTVACAFFIGMLGNDPISFRDFRCVFYFFIQALTYIGLSFLLALLIKKAVLTIGIFFIYSFLIENILEKNLNRLNTGIENIGHFLPLSSSDHLLMFDILKTAMRLANIESYAPENAYLTASVIYIVLIGYACYYLYKKRDL
ncbi:MAG: ABC transporter permease [Prevotellaceae bacterium]|nr:ABC transporter permease [Prevotellaceae bacterium]